ncbi:hypothetical protein ACRRTK_012725 [Alexandromys fortis]
MGLPHRGYSISAGSDADTENEGVMSPEHAMRLWGRGVKSGRSSCLSSRSNSALTLTDTEHENKSDSESEGKGLLTERRKVKESRTFIPPTAIRKCHPDLPVELWTFGSTCRRRVWEKLLVALQEAVMSPTCDAVSDRDALGTQGLVLGFSEVPVTCENRDGTCSLRTWKELLRGMRTLCSA